MLNNDTTCEHGCKIHLEQRRDGTKITHRRWEVDGIHAMTPVDAEYERECVALFNKTPFSNQTHCRGVCKCGKFGTVVETPDILDNTNFEVQP